MRVVVTFWIHLFVKRNTHSLPFAFETNFILNPAGLARSVIPLEQKLELRLSYAIAKFPSITK